MATPKQLLAFDYGTKVIGVAYGQTLTSTTQALAPLKAQDGIPQWELIQQLIDEWQPNLLVVGLPLNMDGSPSELSQRQKNLRAV